jgi:glycerol kinase
MPRHLLAIDQGTTGSTVLVMDVEGRTLGRATHEFPQHFPQPGWVEHEPEEIWQSVTEAIQGALQAAQVGWDQIAAIGITNQRETTLVWERATGRAIHRAIVWQDRRTSDACAELEKSGHGPKVREVTGLVLDPYFSGTKIAWLLDNVPGARQRAEKGELAFGTVDAYLVWRLTGGSVHATDVTNASRTMLMGLRTLAWDEAMCRLLRVPREVLPAIVPSAGAIAKTQGGGAGIPDGIPISGIAGDQQAALFGQACFEKGDVKCTYGTGAFILVQTGSEVVQSRFGLLTTVGWKVGSDVAYALEGSAFVAGAAVQWLRDGLGLIESASEIEALARTVPSSEGVKFVPALAGLGAPYWDAGARGLITGITRGTRAAHVARATLDAIAHQVDDLVCAMADDLGAPVKRMRVDGGAAANDLLMDFQANLSNLVVERPAELESTARGAAMLAGLGVGLFSSPAQAASMSKATGFFRPSMAPDARAELRQEWKQAVQRARSAR